MTPELEIRRLALLSAQGMVAVLRNTADLQRVVLESQATALGEALALLDSVRDTVSGVRGRLDEDVAKARAAVGQSQAELDWINNELGKIVAQQ